MLYLSQRSRQILLSGRVMQEEYQKKFGESFPPYDPGNFPSTPDKLSAEVYIETLREALKRDTPYRPEDWSPYYGPVILHEDGTKETLV